MRRLCIMLLALFVIVTFISTAYTDDTIKTAKAKFNKARKAYILAKEKLSDSEIDALLAMGKAEKQKAVEKVQKARGDVRVTKRAYRAALRELHNAEVARDAKIDRSPWN